MNTKDIIAFVWFVLNDTKLVIEDNVKVIKYNGLSYDLFGLLRQWKARQTASYNVLIDQQLVENILRYCENKQVYDKLGAYGDFYYKLKLRMAGQSIEDNLVEHARQFVEEPDEVLEPELKDAMLKSGNFVIPEPEEDCVIQIKKAKTKKQNEFREYFVAEGMGVITTTRDKKKATRFTNEDADSLCEGLNSTQEDLFIVVEK